MDREPTGYFFILALDLTPWLVGKYRSDSKKKHVRKSN